MINYFKEAEVKKSGLIYNSTLDQIKMLYNENPELAGELAISAIELVLTGDISSNNPMIKVMLATTKEINKSNQDKYERKVENAKTKKIGDQKLDQIAEMYNQGYKQREIATKLGLTQQTVSNRLGLIRSDFPYLLQEKNACTNTLQVDTTCTNFTNTGTSCTKFVQSEEKKPPNLFNF